MKKYFTKFCIAAVLLSTISLTSCILYAVSKAATVTVHVVNQDNESVPYQMVYMFPLSTFEATPKKDQAYQNLATDSKGSVDFKIKEIEIGPNEEKTFIFVTFDGDLVTGSEPVFVKQNEHKYITLHMIK